MKILFVISSLRNGGAERVLQVLSSHLVKNYEIKIAILEEDSGYYKFDERVEILHLDVYKSGKFLAKYRILRQCFKEENPDLIISFIDWTNVTCIIANANLGYKLIATEHNSYELLGGIYARIRDFCYKFANALSVLTRSDFEYYKRLNKNTIIMHNPFFGACGKDEKYEKKNVILSVGRLERVKNYEFYFRALSLVDKGLLSGYEIWILGDGTLRESLENLAKELSLDVKFLGHQSDVSSYYKVAKIFAIFSISEGLPNVLIEAMFYGCARISSDTAGARELIEDGLDGVIFKDEKDMAKKLEKMMRDDEFCKFLSQNAMLKTDEFRVENIVKKWENLIDKVIQNG